jgi:hypothetical protein
MELEDLERGLRLGVSLKPSPTSSSATSTRLIRRPTIWAFFELGSGSRDLLLSDT